MACVAFEHIGAKHYNLLILLIAALSSTILLGNMAWQNTAYLQQVQYNTESYLIATSMTAFGILSLILRW
jgi:hypothetical protein